MVISQEMIEKTNKWLKRYGRPLEVARWEYFIGEGSKKSILQYLQAFQNEDGGFGNGLEPDLWLPNSSSIATWTAAEILFNLDVDADEPIVKMLINYLIDKYDKQTGMWSTVDPETNKYPHAPWWQWRENVQADWMFNPSAELAGYLVHWSVEQSTGYQIGWESIEKAADRLMEAKEMDFHELNNYQKLLDIMISHKSTFESRTNYSLSEASAHVINMVEATIDRDVTNWGTGYRPLPLDLINSLNHPLYSKWKNLIDENIKLYLNEISLNGVCDITWEWGGYPNEFAVSKRYWQAILAVRRYQLFSQFGLLRCKKNE